MKHLPTTPLAPAVTFLAVLLIAVAACAPRAELEPAPAADPVPGVEMAAETTVENVRIVAEPGAWPGRAGIEYEVTPMRVHITNESDHPVRLRYDAFDLVAPDGTTYRAVSPFDVEGTVAEPALVDTFRPIRDPLFRARGFHVAPHLARGYPTLRPYARPFTYDPIYFDRFHTATVHIPLPTEEMVRQALPEGVIDPGGEVEGFIYFEPVPADLDRVSFQVDLVDGDTGDQFAEAEIPFTVDRTL